MDGKAVCRRLLSAVAWTVFEIDWQSDLGLFRSFARKGRQKPTADKR